MHGQTELMAELEIAGQTEDDKLNVGALALTLAATAKPERRREPYQRHLKKMANEVAAYVSGYRSQDSLFLRHEALVQIIHKRYGYVGNKNCFNDVDSANLMHVIESRSGLPVAIGIIYLHIAMDMGWTATGVDFPGRFLIRLDTNEGRLIFDAFEGGKALCAHDLRNLLKSVAGANAELNATHYRKAGTRAVLLRLQNNIKVRHLEAQCPGAALKVLETMVALAPSDSLLWYEAGILNSRLDQVQAAINALENCLKHGSNEQAQYKTSALLQKLRGRLH